MHCSNCGKSIPFAGKVCPWCGMSKAMDQQVQLWALMGAVFSGLLVYLTWNNGCVAFCPGTLPGMVIGILAAKAIQSQKKRSSPSAKPDETPATPV
jgi:predicted nucleic acid-binding Zn ribbon protein